MSVKAILRKYLPASTKTSLKSGLESVATRLSTLHQRPSSYRDFTLTPSELRRRIATYKSQSSNATREAVTWAVLDKLSVNPVYGTYLDTPYFHHTFGGEELYVQAVGASCFQREDFRGSVEAWQRAVEMNPSRLNHLLWSRAARWAGQTPDDVIAILDRGLSRHPGEFSLTLVRAMTSFLAGRTSEANKTLEGIAARLRAVTTQEHPFIPDMTRELSDALRRKLLVRPKGFNKDTYEEQNIRDVFWEDYWCEMTALGRSQFGRAYTSILLQEKIREAIEATPAIGTVINFGVMCADLDYKLALRFPGVQFVGVDRETATAELNRTAYRLPNQTFVAGEILDALPALVAKAAGPVLLFHARTTTLIYPEWVRQFYHRCAALGVEQILLYENIGLSKDHLRYFDFDDLPGDTIVFQNGQYIHHYPKFLSEAGYRVEKEERTQEAVMFHMHDGLRLGDGHVVIRAARS